MRKILNLAIIATFCFIAFVNTGCKKEEITQQVVNLDSLKIAKGLLVGKWIAQNTQTETYSGTILSSKTIEFFPAGTTNVEFKADGTYSNLNKGVSAGSGIWELLSPSYLVMDKGNASQERYYYLWELDNRVLLNFGPFKKDGTFYFPNTVYTFYYNK